MLNIKNLRSFCNLRCIIVILCINKMMLPDDTICKRNTSNVIHSVSPNDVQETLYFLYRRNHAFKSF